MLENKQTTREERAKAFNAERGCFNNITSALMAQFADGECAALEADIEHLNLAADDLIDQVSYWKETYDESYKKLQALFKANESLTAALKDAREGFDQIRTESDQEQIRDIAEANYLNLTNIERAEVKGE